MTAQEIAVAKVAEMLKAHEARWTTHGYERPYDVMHCASADCDWRLRVKVNMSPDECHDAHRAHVAGLLVLALSGSEPEPCCDRIGCAPVAREAVK